MLGTHMSDGDGSTLSIVAMATGSVGTRSRSPSQVWASL